MVALGLATNGPDPKARPQGRQAGGRVISFSALARRLASGSPSSKKRSSNSPHCRMAYLRFAGVWRDSSSARRASLAADARLFDRICEVGLAMRAGAPIALPAFFTVAGEFARGQVVGNLFYDMPANPFRKGVENAPDAHREDPLEIAPASERCTGNSCSQVEAPIQLRSVVHGSALPGSAPLAPHLTVTMDIYSHLTPSMQTVAVGRLDKALGTAIGTKQDCSGGNRVPFRVSGARVPVLSDCSTKPDGWPSG